MDLRITFASLLVATTTLAAPTHAATDQVDLDQTNWLYFPMYPRDSAHAVDLSALQLREDGLLESASRYPRHDHESWSPQADAAGWYAYQSRLIDCRTGHFVPLQARLLDRQGRVLERREIDRDEQAERLARQVRDNAGDTSPDGSEIFLACAAAADEALRERRRDAATAPRPRLTFVPTLHALQRDTETLRARNTYRFDPAALSQQPDSASGMFELAMEDYAAWRDSVLGGAQSAAPPRLSRAQRRVSEAALEAWAQRHFEPLAGTFDIHADGSIGYELESMLGNDLLPEGAIAPEALRSARTFEGMRLDCRSGIALPQTVRWRARDGALLHEMPVPVDLLRDAIEQRQPAVRTAAWNLRNGARQPGIDRDHALCLVAWHARRGELDPDPDVSKPWPALALPDEAALREAATPAAMLHAVRSAWESARP